MQKHKNSSRQNKKTTRLYRNLSGVTTATPIFTRSIHTPLHFHHTLLLPTSPLIVPLSNSFIFPITPPLFLPSPHYIYTPSYPLSLSYNLLSSTPPIFLPLPSFHPIPSSTHLLCPLTSHTQPLLVPLSPLHPYSAIFPH